MKKLVLSIGVLASFLLMANRSQAQTQNSSDYTIAAGLKFGGYEDGLSAKYFATSTVSYEAELGFRSHGVVFTGLYEINQEAFNVPELKF